MKNLTKKELWEEMHKDQTTPDYYQWTGKGKQSMYIFHENGKVTIVEGGFDEED